FRGLTSVPHNRLEHCPGLAVVHQPISSSEPPQRRRTDFGAGHLATVLNDSVSRSNVMQQEVAIWLKDFVAESRRDNERPVYDRTDRRGEYLRNVAFSAANLDVDGRPCLAFFRRQSLFVA